MPEVRVFSSDVFDRIAAILVQAQPVTMANVSLYMWFAKTTTYDIARLRRFHESLLQYIQTENRPPYLVELTQDFPAMFDWYGKDIARSDHALELMGAIGEEINNLEQISPQDFVGSAAKYLSDLQVTRRMEELLGLPWPAQTIKLVVARCLFNQTYVYPDTILCRTDPSCAEYVAMLAHEGGHILTLNMVNAPELAQRDRQLAGDMAEAIAQAVQICVCDQCGIRYEDLFPGQNIHTQDDYLQAHPWRKEKSTLIFRLINDLTHRGEKPIWDVFLRAFMDFSAT